VVDVEDDPEGDASAPGRLYGAAQPRGCRTAQADVVEGDLEAVGGLVQEAGDQTRNRLRELGAVRQENGGEWKRWLSY
jgi:hypothetical protein